MVVRLSVPDQKAAEDLVQQTTTRMLALIQNVRVLFHEIGLRIQEHILERWTSPAAHGIAPLALKTQTAKARRWGYYRRPPGAATFLTFGSPYSFWWTGKALGKALGPDAFKASNTALIYGFGRQGPARVRLEDMHFGGKARPARSIYNIATVHRLVDRTAEDFFEAAFAGGDVFRIENATPEAA